MELCSQFAFCSGDYFGSRVDGGVPGGCGGLGCVGRVRPRNARRQKLLWRKSGVYTFSSSPPPCNHLSFSIWGTVVKWLRLCLSNNRKVRGSRALKGQIFGAYNDPCSLFEGETASINNYSLFMIFIETA